VRIPALGDRRITVEVKLIAPRASMRAGAHRATGDFDLRTFSVRAYRSEVPELRPGMSAIWIGGPRMSDTPKTDSCRSPPRMAWLLHDRMALILIFAVPLFALTALSAVFKQSGDPWLGWGRRSDRSEARAPSSNRLRFS